MKNKVNTKEAPMDKLEEDWNDLQLRCLEIVNLAVIL